MGSTLTSSNSTASMASRRSDVSAARTGSLSDRPGSVSTITLRAPRRRISYPTSRVTPGPCLMLEVSMVKAVSRLLTSLILSLLTVQSRGKRLVHVGRQSPLPSLGEGEGEGWEHPSHQV